ncbi:hypothetical protein [Pseudodesulfovibrio pelocollis]|uniref:hypothetical protein n=1 Tax=Pseudodesulfovibrio pelocollis TaxID=3051432 RepID=UPI00255B1419|nr:hypothetical protein [Pseudodesulfovibrio sp. SB368]
MTAQTLAAAYAERMAVRGVDALYRAPGADEAVACRIILEFAGHEDVGHGRQRRAVIKVLVAEFATPPAGVFEVGGERWQCLETLGKADGHKPGLQWAVLAGSGREFNAEK